MDLDKDRIRGHLESVFAARLQPIEDRLQAQTSEIQGLMQLALGLVGLLKAAEEQQGESRGARPQTAKVGKPVHGGAPSAGEKAEESKKKIGKSAEEKNGKKKEEEAKKEGEGAKKKEEEKKGKEGKEEDVRKKEEVKKKKEEEEAKKKEAAAKKKEEEGRKKEEEKKKKEEEEGKKKEEAKKKKEEESKKKEEEDAKKKEAAARKKEEEIKKKEEIELKKKEEIARKKEEEIKKKEEAIAKKKEDEGKKKEEDGKKKEEVKKKPEEKKSKAEEDKTKLEEEKKAKPEDPKKKGPENKQKKEEEKKKKPEDDKKKIEEEKKKLEEEKKAKILKPKGKKGGSEAKPEEKPIVSKPEENPVESHPDPSKDSQSDLDQKILLTTEDSHDIPSSDATEGHHIPSDSVPHEEKSVPESPEESKSAHSPPISSNPHHEESKSSPAPAGASARLAATLNKQEIEEQIKNLTTQCTPEELSKIKQFEISVGAKSALSLLNTMEDDKFYVGVTPRREVIWTFRLFLQFTGQTLPDNDNEAWGILSEFISDIRNKEKHQKLVDKVILERIVSFDFSNENVDKIELLVCGQNLDPQQFTEICAVSGLLMFTIREAAVYSAVIKGKVPPFRLYARLLHKQKLIQGD